MRFETFVVFFIDKNTRFSLPAACWRCVLTFNEQKFYILVCLVLGSIVVSIPACHAGDRGSIPRRGGLYTFFLSYPFSSLFPFFYVCNTHLRRYS